MIRSFFIKTLAGCSCIVLVAWLTACSHPDNPTPNANQNAYRAEIPLRLTLDTLRQLLTPTLLVRINGVANELILDTGSWGLRILPGALRNANLTISPKLLSYNYGSGTGAIYTRGRQASGTVSFGSLTTSTPVAIMLIDTIRRSLTDPGRSTLDSVTIPNNHFRNVAGILGVGLRNGSSLDVASPLAQLPGTGSFVIRFPAYGQTTGTLVMNPANEELSGFTFFSLAPGAYPLPNGFSSWLDNQLTGIALVNGSLVKAPALLDTGTSPTEIYASGLSNYGLLSQGSIVHLGLASSGQATAVVDSAFTVSNRLAGKDRFYTYSPTTGVASLIYGTNFFYAFDVYYDPRNGRIGVRKK